jgi:spermidine synthase
MDECYLQDSISLYSLLLAKISGNLYIIYVMKRRVVIAILVMGFSGLVAEILLLRELLIIFSGNELSIGIILANWLILEALGCLYPGRMIDKSKNKLEAFTVITVLFSVFFLIAVFLTRILKNILGISIGEMVGFLPMFYSSFLILLPVSVLHGALFTFSARIFSMFAAQDASSTGRVYVYETVGTIIGGIVCTFLLIPYLTSIQASVGIALLNFMVCFYLLVPYRKIGLYQKSILIILGVLILYTGYVLIGGQAEKLHRYAIQLQWKDHNVVHYQNSQYGNICVVENQGQYIFFQDGIPTIIIPVPDMIFVEEFVHLPLLAHPRPENILILRGGAGGVINEILQHPSIQTIEYAELDPLLLELIRKFPTPLTESELHDDRVSVKLIDGRLLLKTTPEKYDLIFVGIMEPSNLQANRYFTREFFSLVQERLDEDGILVLGAPGSLTYLNEELKNLNSSIYHTLKSVFSHIRVIPGDGRNLFFSSDSPGVTTIDLAQIIKRLDERDITPDVLVPWHIERKLHDGWKDWLTDFLEGSSQNINYDFKPLGLFYSIAHWNALYSPGFGRIFNQFERINVRNIFLVLFISLVVYLLIRSRSKRTFRAGVPFAIITTGFAGMLYSLMVIFAFQSVYGYVFSWIGLLVASFMAGAACGAILVIRVLTRLKLGLTYFKRIELAIICFTIFLPFIFFVVNLYSGDPTAFLYFRILFLVVSFISGLLIGSQFPLANKLYLKDRAGLSRTAGSLFASDLLGGWLGGIIGAVILLPVLGLTGTCLTVALLKIVSFIIISTEPTGLYKEEQHA